MPEAGASSNVRLTTARSRTLCAISGLEGTSRASEGVRNGRSEHASQRMGGTFQVRREMSVQVKPAVDRVGLLKEG
jgi:hypothetical protein